MGHDTELREAWFMVAKEEDLELKNKLNELNRAYLSAEEQAAMEEAMPYIQEAKRRYNEDKSFNKLAFITWLNDTYVPEARR